MVTLRFNDWLGKLGTLIGVMVLVKITQLVPLTSILGVFGSRFTLTDALAPVTGFFGWVGIVGFAVATFFKGSSLLGLLHFLPGLAGAFAFNQSKRAVLLVLLV